MKGTARKVRRIYNGEVVVGFAGSVADAFTLEEKFEGKLNEYNGNLQRAAVELAQEWRTQQSMQKTRSNADRDESGRNALGFWDRRSHFTR